MRRFLSLLAFFCTLAPYVSAGKSKLPGYEDRPAIQAFRLQVGETISVDGRLDEEGWKRAEPASDFVQQDPHNGQPATERTEVRILFNEHSLYMGVICYDSEPDKIQANQMQRDGNLNGDDAFKWVLDPYLNGTSGYSFATNPNGLMSDNLLGGSGGWDGLWYERVRRTDIGWTIEVEIPFRTLAFDSRAPAWGINFQRTVTHKNEEDFWNGWGRNQGLNRLTNAGLLEGLENINQGVGLNVQPYIVGKFQEAPLGPNAASNAVPATYKGTYGGDLIYSITPKLKATFTTNTDFAETEVDQRQVNLTRFNLSFPERRTFFLEGSNFLGFAGGVTPYYSRNIGLNGNPEDPGKLTPQRILFGGKLTGQVGAYDLGFVHVDTAESGQRTGEDFTVFRGRRRFLRQSYVGAIFTRRADRGGLIDDRMTAGADFSLATSQFKGNHNLSLAGFYAENTNLAKTSGNGAYGLTLNFPNDLWSAQMTYREIQQNWNPAVGFTQRRNVRFYNPQVQFGPRPKNNRIFRRFEVAVYSNVYTDLQNVERSMDTDIELLEADTHAGDLFSVHVHPSFERPERDFQISKGIILPKDVGYHFTQSTARAQTSTRRKLAIDTTYHWGTFYSGHQHGVIATLSGRAHRGQSLSADYQWNRVELKEGKFSTSLYRTTINTQFSPLMALSNSIQYDNVSRVLGWQSRFRWILKPGNELYLVYSHNWLSSVIPQAGMETLSRNAATKVIYTYQF